jgi:hypothetical protein
MAGAAPQQGGLSVVVLPAIPHNPASPATEEPE